MILLNSFSVMVAPAKCVGQKAGLYLSLHPRVVAIARKQRKGAMAQRRNESFRLLAPSTSPIPKNCNAKAGLYFSPCAPRLGDFALKARSILPFGGYKGYGLGLVAEILAGALTGSGCSQPGKTRLEQSMLSIILDASVFGVQDHSLEEVTCFVDYVKSSEKVSPTAEILVPGDVERRNRAERLARGIELDENTWNQIATCAQSLGVRPDLIADAKGGS
jgi:hypothetical protein